MSEFQLACIITLISHCARCLGISSTEQFISKLRTFVAVFTLIDNGVTMDSLLENVLSCRSEVVAWVPGWSKAERTRKTSEPLRNIHGLSKPLISFCKQA